METDGSFSIQNAHFNADSESKTNATIYVNEVNRNKFVIYKPQKKRNKQPQERIVMNRFISENGFDMIDSVAHKHNKHPISDDR